MAQGYFCCLVFDHSTHRAQYHLSHAFAFRSHDRGRGDGENRRPNGSGYERKQRSVGAEVPLGEIAHERWG